MRIRQVFLYLLVLLILNVGNNVNAQNTNGDNSVLKLMSYNIKFDSPTFEPAWEVRKKWQVDMINQYKPDIIGTQEGLKKQVDYLQEELPDYVVVGEGRKGGDDDEHMAIFFKRDKFRLREMGSFQLSETPEIIGSGPEVNPRMVTWVRLALLNDETNPYPQDYRGHWENTKEFYVFNTHFFNGKKDSLARLNAAKLIMERVRKLERFGEWTKERPVFLMGDFNCRPGSAPYMVLVDPQNKTNQQTFSDSAPNNGKEIDWILYKGKVKVNHYEIINYNVDGVFPSDHKPISVELKLME